MASPGLAVVALIGVALLALCELVAWALGPRTARSLGALAVALGVTAGVTMVVVAVATIPVRDSAGLLALGATSVVLVALVLVRVGGAGSRS